jgi:outer membrane protein assembly factor BamB
MMAALILVGCAVWTLLRTDGIMGAGGAQLAWRWSPTAEERLLARPDVEPKVVSPASEVSPSPSAAEVAKDTPVVPADKKPSDAPAAPAPPAASSAVAEWPGFRGPDRDGVVHGVQLQTDWAVSPPVQIWRRAIGPGWSSFAVQGDVLYTQEQRGEDEIVAAYKVSTGEPVWRHRDPARFYESNGGPGPRGTPTLAHGRVYAFGATGVLNVLDARTGAKLWSRNVATDANRKVPDWGFASSPLVLDDEVIVAASGTLAAYDLSGGKPRWLGPAHGGSYSSPQLVTIDGVPQVILMQGAGVTSVDPSTGKALWEYEWEGGAIVQPAVIGAGDIVINTIAMTGGVGTRRISVAHGANAWTVQERWTSNGLKPYYNDFVIHKGYAYGFDGSILACIDLEDGKRKWKGGRYGNGQLVLLPDQDAMLVLSEEGELALVKASPDQFTEIARFPALQGKTWNHPVLVGNVLLVRNGEEMAAFRMPLAGRSE